MLSCSGTSAMQTGAHRGAWMGAVLVGVTMASPALSQTARSKPSESSHAGGDRTLPSISSAVREEARQRFDRGLQMLEAEDMNGAVAEFERTYALTRHPRVLYNLAIVYASLGRATDAADACAALEVDGLPGLEPEEVARIRRLHLEQRQRIGRLVVRVDVPGANIQVDNVDVATTPTPPIRLTAGTHLVGVRAPGYEPRHLSVTIAGRASEVIDLELVPSTNPVAYLEVSTNVSDVEVYLGPEKVAATPIGGPLAVKPGSYTMTLRRTGYRDVERQIELMPGATFPLEVRMEPELWPNPRLGELRVSVSESQAVVMVDGDPRHDYVRGVRLPVGRHVVRIDRAGFYPVDREVWVHPGSQVLALHLSPTPSYLAGYVRRNRRIRRASYAMLGIGSGLLVGSGGFLIWNRGREREAQRAYDRYVEVTGDMPPGTCDAACRATALHLLDDLERSYARYPIGWAGLGIGGAALLSGILLYVLGDDPNRYEPDPDDDVFRRITATVGGSGITVSYGF